MSDKPLLDQLLDPFTQCLHAESAQRVGTLTRDERADYEAQAQGSTQPDLEPPPVTIAGTRDLVRKRAGNRCEYCLAF